MLVLKHLYHILGFEFKKMYLILFLTDSSYCCQIEMKVIVNINSFSESHFKFGSRLYFSE